MQNTYKKMLKEPNISFVENPNFDLFELISLKQHRSTLFFTLRGLLYYEMRRETKKHMTLLTLCCM